MSESRTSRRVGLALAALLAAALPAAAEGPARPALPGFVDGSELRNLVGEDAVRLEVSLENPLLRALTGVDPELERLAGGLESIHAVILELESSAERDEARRTIRRFESRLNGRGWQRLAFVQDESSEVRVLALSDGEKIQGLVVMVLDREGDGSQLVFANIAGTLDLAAIQRIGEGFDVPGLEGLDLEEPR